jgi:hypothetical protein
MCEDQPVSREWSSGELVRRLREAVRMTLLFSVSCIVASGCGSSQKTATVAAADNALSVAKAHARAYARQVNLTQTDVPGAEVIADEEESGPPSQKALAVARCAGAVLPDRRIADIRSSTLRVGNVVDEATRVKSSIEVQPTAVVAARNYAALASARDRTCIALDLPQLAEGGARPTHIGPTTVTVLPHLLPKGQNAFGFRIKTTITGASPTGRQRREILYLDDYGFVAGGAEVSLNDIRASRPPPTALERHLLTLLYSRAQVHKP